MSDFFPSLSDIIDANQKPNRENENKYCEKDYKPFDFSESRFAPRYSIKGGNVPTGSWTCKKCKRVNPLYVGTCACGWSKNANMAKPEVKTVQEAATVSETEKIATVPEAAEAATAFETAKVETVPEAAEESAGADVLEAASAMTADNASVTAAPVADIGSVTNIMLSADPDALTNLPASDFVFSCEAGLNDATDMTEDIEQLKNLSEEEAAKRLKSYEDLYYSGKLSLSELEAKKKMLKELR